MKEIQQFLIKKGYDDIVLNKEKYPENTPENAKKWKYLSDVINEYVSERQENIKHSDKHDSKALHIADVSKRFDFNDVFAPIEDALYATNSFTTDQARNLAEGIVQYIKDAGFDIIKVDNS